MTKQERAVTTRRDLIRSAAVAFDRYGYAQATLSDISRQAGVSTGALHFHFANKAALAEAVEEDATEALRSVVREAYRSRESALQALTDASHGVLRLLRGNIVFRAGFQLNADFTWESGLDLRREWHTCVRRFVDEAAQEGALVDDVVPGDVTVTIMAVMTGYGLLGREEREWFSQRMLTGFWELLLPRIAAADTVDALVPGGGPVPAA
ncbi:TetR family transcriptional regulator [Streptomyces xanthochromogenes]|uniref:ScbR family autoregulator-binding transcription factor n=1 Tax=Streptomyces xanthochromogenes TaxID=67384 RepID=UPI001672EA34|nr:ScbR family autoregulator-binding transcription factor [Streptomyces xanthochromogenes]GHB75398.1 TetR family transcriptional regulator [Streptomyces xanthochromogenes]